MKFKTLHQERVEEFMRLAGQEVPLKPTEPSEAVRLLRAKLIYEEAMETIYEGLGIEILHQYGDDPHFQCVLPFDLIKTIDGCCDLKVVTTGTLSACGVYDMLVQSAVDRNNCEKFGPGSYRREDGKWIKPPDHQPPDLKSIIDNQS